MSNCLSNHSEFLWFSQSKILGIPFRDTILEIKIFMSVISWEKKISTLWYCPKTKMPCEIKLNISAIIILESLQTLMSGARSIKKIHTHFLSWRNLLNMIYIHTHTHINRKQNIILWQRSGCAIIIVANVYCSPTMLDHVFSSLNALILSQESYGFGTIMLIMQMRNFDYTEKV